MPTSAWPAPTGDPWLAFPKYYAKGAARTLFLYSVLCAQISTRLTVHVSPCTSPAQAQKAPHLLRPIRKGKHILLPPAYSWVVDCTAGAAGTPPTSSGSSLRHPPYKCASFSRRAPTSGKNVLC
ncbi:hypothetical protein B0H13DRAFT_2317507 [Mycena leptocephala]|nr:hypothetical protein B0H13DRAFT_2317507 [Mycena leptocephala]